MSTPGASLALPPSSAVSPHRVFWATWAGWMLDGFDLGIYIFVLVPAVTEILILEGIAPTKANVAQYGAYLFSVFMVGWALSMVWGWCADRFGRVRVMCITILWYSIFTALCGFATSIEALIVCRFLAGFGVGGEWAAGTTLLHESVPGPLRVRLAGWLHTAVPIGLSLASVAALLVGSIGWRGVFLIGIAPALLAVFLRLKLPEPDSWKNRTGERVSLGARELFARPMARTTWTAALIVSVAIFGLWSSTFWIPTLVVTSLTEAGVSASNAHRMSSFTGILINGGTLAACLLSPWIVTVCGSRRRAVALFFCGSFAVNVLGYFVILTVLKDVYAFIWLTPLLGFFTNGVFALFTIWLPEMFPASIRASGAGFAFNFGRILGAAGPLLVGALVAQTDSYPIALSWIAFIYVIALPLFKLATRTTASDLDA